MTETDKLAILLGVDTLVGKSLELVLADIGIEVVAVRALAELERRRAPSCAVPSLLIMSLPLTEPTPGEIEKALDTVRRVRRHYREKIPAILLGDEMSSRAASIAETDLVLMTDWMRSDRLREQIRRFVVCGAGA